MREEGNSLGEDLLFGVVSSFFSGGCIAEFGRCARGVLAPDGGPEALPAAVGVATLRPGMPGTRPAMG